MSEKLATGAAVDADGRHSLSAAHDRCPVCGSTEAHCLTMERRPCAPHLARRRRMPGVSLLGARIAVSSHLAQAIDALAARADVSPSTALECLIWRALRRIDGRTTSPPDIAAWQRIAAALASSHPPQTETR